jgi:hypothetical protein
MTDPMPAIRSILGFPADADHIAEAKAKSEAATHLSFGDSGLLAVLTEGLLHTAIAQAEATEALVEQQRVGNLIALAALTDPESDSTLTPLEITAWRGLAEVGTGEMRPEIREALGLA